MEPVVDLIAVAYQAPHETERFLLSMEHVSTPFSLTIVENNSPDPRVKEILTSVLISEIKSMPNCARVEVVFNDENVGYARAINQAALPASAPYLAALNCDIRFLQEGLQGIIDHFEENPRVGIIGPKTLSSEGLLTHAGILTDASGRDLHRAWMGLDNPAYNDTLDVPTVSGATYFVRRECWDELTMCPEYRKIAPDSLGAFLPTSHFYEETWCSYHARAHDWKVQYLGSVSMIHEWHRSSPVGSRTLNEAEGQFREACAGHEIALTF